MKKYMILLVMSLCFIIIIEGNYSVTSESQNQPLGDELDQYQMHHDFLAIAHVINESWYMAQSFIPQKPILTRVQLLLGKDPQITQPITVSIRSSLTGSDIISSEVDANDVSGWTEFDFDNIAVTPGDTYYIIVSAHTTLWYTWTINMSDVYPNGTVFLSTDDVTWEEQSNDSCFKTYGIQSTTVTLKPVMVNFGSLSTIITNTGEHPAEHIELTINIQGGLKGSINISSTGVHSLLDPDEQVTIKTDEFISGLGIARGTYSVKAANDLNPSTVPIIALVLGPLFFVFTTS